MTDGVLAALYDIHGNLPALDAVLEDAETRSAERFLLGGDYALFGPWPSETVNRLGGLTHATWLRGNAERWTAHPADAPAQEPVTGAIAACRRSLGPEAIARLGELPEQVVEDGCRFCHASPVSDVRSFTPTAGPGDHELLDDATEPRLVFGHTHLPFRRVLARTGAEVELVNPGSVGMPFDGDPRASYALLTPGRPVEHRRVGYDHRASARALRERFGEEWAEQVAVRIERARLT